MKIEDTGPLTMKRMETIDNEITTATPGFINRKNACMHSVDVIQRHLWFTLLVLACLDNGGN